MNGPASLRSITSRVGNPIDTSAALGWFLGCSAKLAVAALALCLFAIQFGSVFALAWRVAIRIAATSTNLNGPFICLLFVELRVYVVWPKESTRFDRNANETLASE